MTLQKLTIKNSVKYVPKVNKQKRDIKQKTVKNNSIRRKQGKGNSQNNKRFLLLIQLRIQNP